MIEVIEVLAKMCCFYRIVFGKEQDIRQELYQFLHEKDLYLSYVDPVIWSHSERIFHHL